MCRSQLVILRASFLAPPPPPPPPNAQRLFMILYLIKPVCFCTVCCLLQDGALERVQNTAEALLVAPDISNEVELQVLNSPRLYIFLMVYKSRRCCIDNRCIFDDRQIIIDFDTFRELVCHTKVQEAYNFTIQYYEIILLY